MVLAELGGRITSALRAMTNSAVVDQEVLDSLLKEIGNALKASDVNVALVNQLRANIRAKCNLEEIPSGVNKRKVIQKVVVEELCALLDSGQQPPALVKGKSNVWMFVGLQGAGKTTTVGKLAVHYKRAGFKTCMVCADTFRAGAFDQLKQNATKAKIPFYGSYTERDPVAVAREGVASFKAEGFELIIVDTSGRHKQEADLFEEMKQVSAAVQPDNIIFVMDSSIGQAAFDQAKAFRDSVSVGSVIITKMDGHANGGGALSAVAATKSPIIFIGTGEHLDDLEPFATRPFVSKLLGMGDIEGFVSKIREVVPTDGQPQLMERLSQGIFTPRDMYEQFQTIMKMGPLNQVIEMIPGMSQMLNALPGAAKGDPTKKLKAYMTIMDSMTDAELDDIKVLNEKGTRDGRVARIARGAGRPVREVNELLEQFKNFSKVFAGFKGKPGARGGLGAGGMPPRNLAQMSNLLPPGMLKQVGGMAGIQQMMKQLGGMGLGGMPGFGGGKG